MEKNIYRCIPDSVQFTTASAITAGDVVFFGEVAGVSKLDYDAGAVAAVATIGVFDGAMVVAADASGIVAGDQLYWDASNKGLTTTSTGNKFIGVAVPKGTYTPVGYVRYLLNAQYTQAIVPDSSSSASASGSASESVSESVSDSSASA